MNIFKYILSSTIIGISLFTASNAFAFTTDTFILDGGRDLGSVIPQTGNWYVPTIKYNEADKVKQKMLDNFTYPGTFYTDRGFTTSIIDGSDPYFFVKWTYPFKVNTLAQVKSKMDGLEISWRKNGVIHWTSVKDITESYLAGYNDSADSSVIIYPIINKLTKKTVAFLQYPCGNLVCKDTTCSALKPTPYCGDGIVNPELGEACDPKDPKTRNKCTNTCQYPSQSCALTTKKTTYYTNECISATVTKGSYTEILGFSGGTNSFTNSSCIKFSATGNYSITATAKDKNTSQSVACAPVAVKIVNKPVCGDGITQSTEGEICDIGSNNGIKGSGCTSSCKYETPSCTLNITPTGLMRGSLFTSSFFTFTYKGTPISYNFNGNIGTTFTSSTINSCSNKLTYTVANPLNSSITATCYDNFTVKAQSYCGDGSVDKGELCDPKDGKTGMFCTSSCTLKTPSICSIEAGNEYYVGSTLYFGVVKDSYSTITSAKIGTGSISGTSSPFSTNLNKEGTYNLSVTIANALDKTRVSTKTCEKTIVVKPKELCN